MVNYWFFQGGARTVVSDLPPGWGPEKPFDFRWQKRGAPIELKIGERLAEWGSFNI